MQNRITKKFLINLNALWIFWYLGRKKLPHVLFLQCATVLRKYAHWTLIPLSLWIMLFTYSLHSLSLSHTHTHTGIHVNTNTHAHTFSHSLLFHSVYYCMISQFFIQPYVLPSAKPDWHLVSNIEQQLFLQKPWNRILSKFFIWKKQQNVTKLTFSDVECLVGVFVYSA